jgi:hypothetical protein
MSVGFQAFAADASTVLDLTSRVLKIFNSATIGTGYTTGATGTITDARFTAYSGCVPWVAVVVGAFYPPQYNPVLSISGNVLTWTFPDSATTPVTTFIYGIF